MIADLSQYVLEVLRRDEEFVLYRGAPRTTQAESSSSPNEHSCSIFPGGANVIPKMNANLLPARRNIRNRIESGVYLGYKFRVAESL